MCIKLVLIKESKVNIPYCVTDLSWSQELWQKAVKREITCVGSWWSQYDMAYTVLGTVLRPPTDLIRLTISTRNYESHCLEFHNEELNL